ncbi:MAG: hypothetical protein JWQ71_2478 [Pedosphaera sp.]|nr:hypothetical protein [Pedosphaera sp.]
MVGEAAEQEYIGYMKARFWALAEGEIGMLYKADLLSRLLINAWGGGNHPNESCPNSATRK